MLGRLALGASLGALVAGASLPTSDLLSFVAIGDSETYGGQDATGITYPRLLASAIGRGGDVSMLNVGRSGWTSTDIAILMGARDVTLGAFSLSAGWPGTAVTPTFADGGATSFRKVDSYVTSRWTGVLTLPDNSTIVGELRREPFASVTWTFYTTQSGGPWEVPSGAVFHCTEYDLARDRTFLLMAGRNNDFTLADERNAVLFDVAAMLDRQTGAAPGHIVLGIITGLAETTGGAMHTGILAVNDALAAAYGNRFVDGRAWLMANGLAFNGLTPTTDDTNDIAAGTLPRQLYYAADNFHPNRYGYAGLAEAVRQKLGALGWVVGSAGMGAVPIPTGFEYPSTAAQLFTDPGFELGTAGFFLRQAVGYGSAARSASAARSGSWGIRVSFTGSGNGAALDLYKDSLDPAPAHAATLWVRPSKTVSLSLGLIAYEGGYGVTYKPPTLVGPQTNCPANTWTRLAISAGAHPGLTGDSLAVSVLNDGLAWADGDTLDVDDLIVVLGSAVP